MLDYLKKYLEELSILAGHPVQVNELSHVDQAASIREAGKKFALQATTISEISFSNRNENLFKIFTKKLYDANPSPVYVWTPRTIECGAFLLPSICAVNFSFDFTINEEGILVFLTNDLIDRLLLDFTSLPSGEERLRIETQGENWIHLNDFVDSHSKEIQL
jgi:hypothetical protein